MLVVAGNLYLLYVHQNHWMRVCHDSKHSRNPGGVRALLVPSCLTDQGLILVLGSANLCSVHEPICTFIPVTVPKYLAQKSRHSYQV